MDNWCRNQSFFTSEVMIHSGSRGLGHQATGNHKGRGIVALSIRLYELFAFSQSFYPNDYMPLRCFLCSGSLQVQGLYSVCVYSSQSSMYLIVLECMRWFAATGTQLTLYMKFEHIEMIVMLLHDKFIHVHTTACSCSSSHTLSARSLQVATDALVDMERAMCVCLETSGRPMGCVSTPYGHNFPIFFTAY